MSLNEELIQACKDRDVDKILELIRQGANVNVKDEFKDTPLGYLAHSHGLVIKTDLVPAVRALVKAGAKIDGRDSEGNTPLFAAVVCYNEPIALTLIEMGANVNAKSRKGQSVLMEAVRRNLEQVIDALLDAGVDTQCKCKAGKEVLSRIRRDTSPEVVRKLAHHGADVNAGGLGSAITSGNWDAARELIALGAEIDVRGANDETYLMFRSRWGKLTSKSVVEEVKFLVSVGADITLMNSSGQTALDLAIEAGNYEIADVLRDATLGKE